MTAITAITAHGKRPARGGEANRSRAHCAGWLNRPRLPYQVMEDLPDQVGWFVGQLHASGFEQVADERSESFGDRSLVFRRAPLELRLTKDRGQWSVDLIADGWSERDRVLFPLFRL